MADSQDIWSEWLKKRRFGGGDEKFQEHAMQQYKKLALKIVDKSEIFESATVLDIGAGDGLIGFTALERLGPNGKVILSDISEAALLIPKEILKQAKEPDPRIEFLIAGAENLKPLNDCSVDRIVIRAVLLYVNEKQMAFNEIFRVLKNGGIAVIMEPINQRHLEFRNELFRGYRLDREPLLSIKPMLDKVIDETNHQTNETQSTLIGYNEHDLVHMAIGAGFEQVKLEYILTRTQMYYQSWEFFFDSAPNPQAQSLHEMMNKILNQDEFDKVVNSLKKVVSEPAVRTTCEALYILRK